MILREKEYKKLRSSDRSRGIYSEYRLAVVFPIDYAMMIVKKSTTKWVRYTNSKGFKVVLGNMMIQKRLFYSLKRSIQNQIHPIIYTNAHYNKAIIFIGN